MEELIEELKKEMRLLDDEKKGSELRKSLGIEGIEKTELLIFKLDFIIKLISQKNLYCLERLFYFNKLFYSCIDLKDYDDYYYTKCILPNQKMAILITLTDSIEHNRLFYIINDKCIKKIDLETIKLLLEKGMHTITRMYNDDYKEFLIGRVTATDTAEKQTPSGEAK